jgi:hypothetical protein
LIKFGRESGEIVRMWDEEKLKLMVRERLLFSSGTHHVVSPYLSIQINRQEFFLRHHIPLHFFIQGFG